MNTKTMEGLVGARTNMNLMNTPMRVYKEARRRGDTAVMERAMGYAGEFSDKAEEYKAEADKGMEEDAREARKKAEMQREEVIQKRREEREKLEEGLEENRNADANTDTKETKKSLLETKSSLLEAKGNGCLQGTEGCLLELSGEGKVLMKDNMGPGTTGSDEIRPDVIKKPVTYTKTGETVPAEKKAGISVSV